MSNERCDIAIVGAGPGRHVGRHRCRAGSAPASSCSTSTAVRAGRSIAPSPTRRRRVDLLGPDYAAGRSLADAFAASALAPDQRRRLAGDARRRCALPARRRDPQRCRPDACALVLGRHGASVPDPGLDAAGRAHRWRCSKSCWKSADVVPAEPVVLAAADRCSTCSAGSTCARACQFARWSTRRRWKTTAARSALGGALARLALPEERAVAHAVLKRAGVPFSAWCREPHSGRR